MDPSNRSGSGVGVDSPAASPRPAAAVWPTLRKDVVLRAVAVLFAVALVLYALPVSEGSRFWIESSVDLAFLLAAIAALAVGAWRLGRVERRFWGLLASGYAAWATIYALYLGVPDDAWSGRLDLVVDSLYLLFYLAVLTAVETRPDLARLQPSRRLGYFRVPGGVLFACGLFAYLVLIPSVLDYDRYWTWSPSFGLFVALDLYLAGRLVWLSRLGRERRWRFLYLLLACVFGFYAVADGVEWLTYLEFAGMRPDAPASALWLVGGAWPVVAIRLRRIPFPDGDPPGEESRPEALAQGAPFFAYVLILPAIHFAAYRTGLFGEPTRAAHELFALAWLLGLGVVSLVQFLHIGRRTSKLESERRQAEERLRYLASYDGVTGLPNRALFAERLTAALERARRDGRLVAVVFIDLDDFKRVNDSFGHTAGDRLLRRVADRLRARLRSSDTVARFGGDEFTVLLEGLRDAADAERLVTMLGVTLDEPFTAGGQQVAVGASLGVGLYPRDGETAATLLANADAAMYEGKKRKEPGSQKVRFFAEAEHGRVRDRLLWENELRTALRERQFLLYYQPKWTATGLELRGFEALIRWRHPERGVLTPGEFILVAERTGLIGSIDQWVLDAACRQVAEWRRDGFAGATVAVNLSVQQFRDPALPDRVHDALRRYRLDTDAVELELTETMMMSARAQTARIAARLRDAGIRVVIDDFCTGYSSLEHLTSLAPDKVKIDHTFVRNLAADSKLWAVVVAIITMAHRLDIEVVAEGVETETERAFLEEYGCDELQGFYLGRPQPADRARELLELSRDPLAMARRFEARRRGDSVYLASRRDDRREAS